MAALGVKSLPRIGGKTPAVGVLPHPVYFVLKIKMVLLKRKTYSRCWLDAGSVKQGGWRIFFEEESFSKTIVNTNVKPVAKSLKWRGEQLEGVGGAGPLQHSQFKLPIFV